MNIGFLSLADQEVADAISWYEGKEEGLSRDFLDELDRIVRLVTLVRRIYRKRVKVRNLAAFTRLSRRVIRPALLGLGRTGGKW